MTASRYHPSDNVSPDKAGFKVELEREGEDTLLCDDHVNNSVLTTIPVASAKANDLLESTLLKLNDNMLSVSQSMSLIQETLARFADGQELRNCLTQTPTRIMTLLNQTATRCLKKGEKSNPTRELKDDLLDKIAIDLSADE